MELDYRFSILISQLGWALPTAIVVIVIAVMALMRRGSGLWWKLVVAGVAALLLGELISLVGNVFLHQIHSVFGSYWLFSIPAILLNVTGLGLLGAGAIVGRGGQVPAR